MYTDRGTCVYVPSVAREREYGGPASRSSPTGGWSGVVVAQETTKLSVLEREEMETICSRSRYLRASCQRCLRSQRERTYDRI